MSLEISNSQYENPAYNSTKTDYIINSDCIDNISLSVKLNHLETRAEKHFKKYDALFSELKDRIISIENNIELLLVFKENSSKNYDLFHNDFLATSSHSNEFIFNTTTLLNEILKDLNKYRQFYEKSKSDLESIKCGIADQINHIKSSISNEISLIQSSFTAFKCAYKKEKEDLESNLQSENLRFTKFIQEKMVSFIDKTSSDLSTKLSEFEGSVREIRKKQVENETNFYDIKTKFFHNLNEVEETMSKKVNNIEKYIEFKL